MKVLIVCSRRSYAPYADYMAPFIYDQIQAVQNQQEDIEFETFFINGGRGGRAYIEAFFQLHKHLRKSKPDVIHAHYGLSAALTAMVLKTTLTHRTSCPFIITLHGSDVNEKSTRKLSQFAQRAANKAIYVSQPLFEIAGKPANGVVIPCGVDTKAFQPMDKQACRKALNLLPEQNYILFSKQFSDRVKNYPLARQAVTLLHKKIMSGQTALPQNEPILLEFMGFTRAQVPMLYNAVDACLMTSFTEGSPQFVKEAVACGCPIVSTDVGDVRHVLDGVQNAAIIDYDAAQIAAQLQKVMEMGHLRYPQLPKEYHQTHIANQLIAIYENNAC